MGHPKWQEFTAGLPEQDGSYYARGKALELEKDFGGAMAQYIESIRRKERRSESAVKDLAGILHSQDRTQEGVELLEKFVAETKVRKPQSLHNMISYLRKQLEDRPEEFPRKLLVCAGGSGLAQDAISKLFGRRGEKIVAFHWKNSHEVVVEWPSFSSAKRALAAVDSTEASVWWHCESEAQLCTVRRGAVSKGDLPMSPAPLTKSGAESWPNASGNSKRGWRPQPAARTSDYSGGGAYGKMYERDSGSSTSTPSTPSAADGCGGWLRRTSSCNTEEFEFGGGLPSTPPSREFRLPPGLEDECPTPDPSWYCSDAPKPVMPECPILNRQRQEIEDRIRVLLWMQHLEASGRAY